MVTSEKWSPAGNSLGKAAAPSRREREILPFVRLLCCMHAAVDKYYSTCIIIFAVHSCGLQQDLCNVELLITNILELRVSN